MFKKGLALNLGAATFVAVQLHDGALRALLASSFADASGYVALPLTIALPLFVFVLFAPPTAVVLMLVNSGSWYSKLTVGWQLIVVAALCISTAAVWWLCLDRLNRFRTHQK